MSRRPGPGTARVCFGAVLLLGSAAAAQDQGSSVDTALAQAREAYGPPPDTEPCTAEQEAATISGEIVVCRRRVPDDDQRLRSAREGESRYAAATRDAGDLRAPDLARPACKRGSPGCFYGGWVPPPVYMVDFSTLPEAPPGSDAERIAQGLAPTGGEGSSPVPATTVEERPHAAAALATEPSAALPSTPEPH